MLRFALLIAAKDLRLTLLRGRGLAQALLLGLLLIFIFSLAKNPGEHAQPREAAAIFWLSSLFCQTLVFNLLYALEEENDCRQGLLLSPFPSQGIWLGKALAALIILLVAQIVFFPAIVVFLAQTASGPIGTGLGALLVADAGICALGSLLGAIGQGRGGRDALLSIILFPLLIPLLLAAISLDALALGAPDSGETGAWLGMACAFDAVFIACGLLLFGFLYKGDE